MPSAGRHTRGGFLEHMLDLFGQYTGNLCILPPRARRLPFKLIHSKYREPSARPPLPIGRLRPRAPPPPTRPLLIKSTSIRPSYGPVLAWRPGGADYAAACIILLSIPYVNPARRKVSACFIIYASSVPFLRDDGLKPVARRTMPHVLCTRAGSSLNKSSPVGYNNN